jgi:hypothetical protein
MQDRSSVGREMRRVPIFLWDHFKRAAVLLSRGKGDLGLTSKDGCCTVWPKDKVQSEIPVDLFQAEKELPCATLRSFSR